MRCPAKLGQNLQLFMSVVVALVHAASVGASRKICGGRKKLQVYY